MIHDDICYIPSDKTVTYARIVVDYRPQKADPNRVHLTVGGNLLNVLGELSTATAEHTTSKILCNTVISTKYARCACIDIKKKVSPNSIYGLRIYADTPQSSAQRIH